MRKSDCNGCRNNFYNGNNSIGVNECWSFKTAKLVYRIPIGYWEPPPYKNKKKVMVPDCCRVEGTCYIKPEAINSEGFWK